MIDPKKEAAEAAAMVSDSPRLIEEAFPLKQASIDSVHEKNVRHGHISTLHIWPARRPLAACRAALIATLLPDPGTPEERKELIEKMGGKVVQKIKKKKLPSGKTEEKLVEETEGGILHWGRETENKETLDWFRGEIKKAYGGRVPRVLDPFAGGGAIPLEAMRLGCEVTAIDINPVAWFILKCTLEYPQTLAGHKKPLPSFVLKDRDFMESFFKAQGYKGASLRAQLEKLGLATSYDPQLPEVGAPAAVLEADLAWHVRAWGLWVLNRARKELATFYPTYADFEPLDKSGPSKWASRERLKVPIRKDGTLDLKLLNAEFNEEYLDDKKKPRWIPKPTVAYLWARTVKCKNCRATIPLLKTRWLCKRGTKRVVLTMDSNPGRTGVVFGIQSNVPQVGGNAAQRRENDKRVGQGTINKSGAWCPSCSKPGTVAMTTDDIRQEGQSGRLGAVLTAVVTNSNDGKEYRRPTAAENLAVSTAAEAIEALFSLLPFGLPTEETPGSAGTKRNSSSLRIYGFTNWTHLFNPRQLLSLGTFALATREARDAITLVGQDQEWAEAICAYLACGFDRLCDYSSTICLWALSEFLCHTFTRYALPITWDFVEGNPIGETSGNYNGAIDWVSRVVEHLLISEVGSPTADVKNISAKKLASESVDIIITDPPYYDAIAYSDLMDYFYVWLRRLLANLSVGMDEAFRQPLGPKWNQADDDGELIDNPAQHAGDFGKSRIAYEGGMLKAFAACFRCLNSEGKLVIVFAHKHPDAWESLVSAIVQAGFVVDASWPIQTERETRMRAYGSAALASSVWLVCKKRSETARPGWDNNVLDEMRERIHARLRDFWDAGIRGPDFVWAATGPALEAFSKHPVVKKANEPGQMLTVPEFLRSVRRIVVDFVVGRVLSQNGDAKDVSGLDDITTYYLLHRHDFGMEDAPIGACILYAISCGLSDTALADQFDILTRTGGQSSVDEEDEEEAPDEASETEIAEGTGSKVKLLPWNQRKRKSIGYEAPGGRPVPLIDQVHRLMHLWKTGEVIKVDEYLDARGLRRNALFHQILQALIELAAAGSDERSYLESISNHVAARGVAADKPQTEMQFSE